MVTIVLIRPGSTSFDEEGRIKGALDMPLSLAGESQAERTAQELSNFKFDGVYSAPCESALQTADIFAKRSRVKYKIIDELRNLDHGLWQGKLIEDVKRQQPKVYKQFQECPDHICPPGGETVEDARGRMRKMVTKLLKRHHNGCAAVIVPEPQASLLKNLLLAGDLGDLWKSELDAGQWEMLTVNAEQLVEA